MEKLKLKGMWISEEDIDELGSVYYNDFDEPDNLWVSITPDSTNPNMYIADICYNCSNVFVVASEDLKWIEDVLNKELEKYR